VGVSTKPPIRLDLGAGEKEFPGFIRVGLEEAHEIHADLRSIPLPDNYADEAQAIHVIEHFYRWETVDVLREWRRILKPGGLLVLELPDIGKCCRNVLKDMEKSASGMWAIYGDPNTRDPLMMHKWGFTPHTLAECLLEAGYVRLRHRLPRHHHKRVNRDFRMEARKP
jgi:SAM-dependent methyltransferase